MQGAAVVMPAAPCLFFSEMRNYSPSAEDGFFIGARFQPH